MSTDNKANGDFAINPTQDPDIFNGRIRQPNEDVVRDIKLKRTKNGHLVGYIQPANPQEELALRAFRSSERKGDVSFDNLQEGVSGRYQDTDKGPRIVYSLDDVVNPEDGTVFDLRPGQVVVFDHLDKVLKHQQDVAAGDKPETSKAPAAYSGYAVTYAGQVTTPAAWAKEATKDKDGNELKKPRLFFSGFNTAYDSKEYVKAKADKAGKPAKSTKAKTKANEDKTNDLV